MITTLALASLLLTTPLERPEAVEPQPVRIDEPSARLFPKSTGPWFVAIHLLYGGYAGVGLGNSLRQPVWAVSALAVASATTAGLVGFLVQRAFPLSVPATVTAFFVGFGGFMLGASVAYVFSAPVGTMAFDVAMFSGALLGAPLLLLGWAAVPDTPELGWFKALAPFAVGGVVALLTYGLVEATGRDARLRQPGGTLIVLIPTLAFIGTRVGLWANDSATPTLSFTPDGRGGLAVGPAISGQF
jgi:hypothetical protein